jgi:hypothetical protein
MLLHVAAGLLAFADTPLFPLGPKTQVSSFTPALFFVFRVLALVLPQIPPARLSAAGNRLALGNQFSQPSRAASFQGGNRAGQALRRPRTRAAASMQTTTLPPADCPISASVAGSPEILV